MRNIYLSDRTAADIDARVARVLKGLGNPRPPLRLELVRDLLRLDRRYFSSGDPSAAQEFVHKLTMAGKQLALRPTLIWDVIKKWDLRALYLHDRKRILLDSNLPEIKQRWGEAHEIGHSLMDWHEVFALGDDQHSLSPSCHAQLEAEANFAAAVAFSSGSISGRVAGHRSQSQTGQSAEQVVRQQHDDDALADC